MMTRDGHRSEEEHAAKEKLVDKEHCTCKRLGQLWSEGGSYGNAMVMRSKF